MKYLGINLTKEEKNSENHKTLMKETGDSTNKWTDITCSWSERINIVKMSILPKATYNVIPISSQCNSSQNTNGIFQKTKTNNFIICMGPQKTLNSQNNLEKDEKSWRNHTP